MTEDRIADYWMRLQNVRSYEEALSILREMIKEIEGEE